MEQQFCFQCKNYRVKSFVFLDIKISLKLCMKQNCNAQHSQLYHPLNFCTITVLCKNKDKVARLIYLPEYSISNKCSFSTLTNSWSYSARYNVKRPEYFSVLSL